MNSIEEDVIKHNGNVFNKKEKIFLWLIAVIISSIVIAKYAYSYYEENKVIINRNFNGLKFGDSPSQASSIFGNRPDLIWASSEGDESGSSYCSVAYGDRTIDTLELSFYMKKLYAVRMIFNITYQDQENNWTFNRFKNLFERKGYSQTYTEYHNVLKFEDKHTRLRLWHSIGERYYNPNPRICITYYDKDSGFREKMDSGF